MTVHAQSPAFIPPSGHYACATYTFTGGGIGATISSIGTGIDLMPGGEYRTLGEKGKYHTDKSSDRLIWDSGPLQHAVAHVGKEANGNPKITFKQNENRQAINGHEIDHGPTTCYYKRTK